MEELAPSQARKIILHSQGLPPGPTKGRALEASLAAIEKLGYIQIDTLAVIHRAHDHTFWNRNPRYKPNHIDKLMEQGKIFEYWSHAASYLPMKDFRFSLPRKEAIKRNEQSHWYDRDEKLMQAILKRIKEEGPLMARDFQGIRDKSHLWGTKPTKQALENLYMQGDLMVPRRINFQKVYDLTERVLPAEVDTSMPSQREMARYLVESYLRANGLGQINEICYLRGEMKKDVEWALMEMLENKEVLCLKVLGKDYFMLPSGLELLNKPLARRKLKILSPFDNLIIQRKRIKDFFHFDYQLECYVPAEKRVFGYFVLPILWNGRLVARMDCKRDLKNSTLHIHRLDLEPSLKKLDAFYDAFHQELKNFMLFNECSKAQLPHKSYSHSV